MRDPQDPGGEGRSPGERDDDRELDSAAGIGPRVSAVFTAAEQAAEHILQMARAEVDDLRRSTDAEIEAFRAQRRADAEREARQIVEDAQAEAEMIRSEATRAAQTVEDAARRREQWIDEGIRLVVERAEWGRRGLQEVIERLEEFAVRAPGEWSELAPPPSDSEPEWPAARMAGAASSSPPGADDEGNDAGTTVRDAGETEPRREERHVSEDAEAPEGDAAQQKGSELSVAAELAARSGRDDFEDASRDDESSRFTP